MVADQTAAGSRVGRAFAVRWTKGRCAKNHPLCGGGGGCCALYSGEGNLACNGLHTQDPA